MRSAVEGDLNGSRITDGQRTALAVVAAIDLVLAGLLILLGRLMVVATDMCPIDRTDACASSAEAAFQMNAIGQLIVFALAAIVAVKHRTFWGKLLALFAAPVLGWVVWELASASIVTR